MQGESQPCSNCSCGVCQCHTPTAWSSLLADAPARQRRPNNSALHLMIVLTEPARGPRRGRLATAAADQGVGLRNGLRRAAGRLNWPRTLPTTWGQLLGRSCSALSATWPGVPTWHVTYTRDHGSQAAGGLGALHELLRGANAFQSGGTASYGYGHPPSPRTSSSFLSPCC